MDFNHADLSIGAINVALNEAIERAAATTAELPRPYLGASAVGDECLRKIQYDWWCKPILPARTREIFARGHFFEARVRQQLVAAGCKFAPPEALEFTAVNGLLRGHADGIIIAGPQLLACISTIIHLGSKAINAKNCARSNATGWRRPFRATPHR